ncbi:FISUMP domain-containing protein [Elizabethkingia meningoseptica]|uniref:FISUMP domain-containing protein n=1 Tax=Elizabethkingia meningoseptica TaxID=238 RepID=UPI0023B1C6BB|nr:FISUMP domain-containing protein [Elizabethkingia meningoseptica]
MMNKRNILNRIYYLIILGILFSCSPRDEDPVTNNNTPKGNFLNLLIIGIEGKDNNIVNTKTATTGKAFSTAAKNTKEELISFGNYNALVSIEKPEEMPKTANTSKTLNPQATVSMENNIKYRLLLFRDRDKKLVSNSVITAGQPLTDTIRVDAGEKYQWYTISANDSQIPPDINDQGIVSGVVNKDFLYDGGTLNAASGQNDLSIIFKRRTFRITVELDVSQIEGHSIQDVTTDVGTGAPGQKDFTSSIIRTGDFNIFTNEYSNVKEAPESGRVITAANMTGTRTIKTATFYTVGTPADQNYGLMIEDNTLRVKFSNFSLLYSGGIKDIGEKIVPYNNAIYHTPNIGTALGNSMKLIARLKEGSGTSIEIGGIFWAMTNLIYVPGASPENRYQFRADNNYTRTDSNEFWKWMSLMPGPGGTAGSGDPCRKVVPENTWRMPTQSELRTILEKWAGGIYQIKREYTGSPLYRYQQLWEIDGNSNNVLNLGYHGYLSTFGTLMEAPSGSNFPSARITAYYWHSDQSGNSGSATVLRNSNGSWSSLSYDFIDKNTGGSVRCVKIQ